MLRRAVTVLLGFSLLPAFAPLGAQQSPAAGPAVTAIGVVSARNGTQVTISGDADLNYEFFEIDGKSLVVDVPGAVSKVWPAEQQVDDDFVGRIRVAEQRGDKPGVRIAFDLKRPDSYAVRGAGGTIVIAFAAPPERSARPVPQAPRVSGVRVVPSGAATRVQIETTIRPAFRVLDSADPRQVTIALEGVALSPELAAAVYANPDGLVTRVAARADDRGAAGVLVTVVLREPAPFRVDAGAAGLSVEFSAPAPAVRGPVPAPSALETAPAPAALPSAAPFSGRRITLDFVDADISDIFRLVADVSGINIVAGDDVRGKRSIKLSEIPWDQALDLILKTNIPPLVQIAEGPGVLRITTLQRVIDDQTAADRRRLEQLQRGAEEQKRSLERAEAGRKLEVETQAQQIAKLKAERQRSKGWREKTFAISYGDTTEVAGRLKKFYSGCEDGCIFEPGTYSKTIFVRDFVDNIEQMTAVLNAIEAPTPAVMVEARIVEIQSDYSQALGIQWGGKFVADPAHGNATQFAFPNSIAVGGAVQDGVNPGTFLVNLPAANAVSGVGVTLGHIANTFSLDMKLSAMEKMGRSKVLSSPKILAVQDTEAEINIGSQLPVPKTDAEGNRTVEWKKVGITLKVTPRVTSDNRIFMSVDIKKDAKSETVKTTEGEMFSIEDRSAKTKVLVADGETSVIGGIFQQSDSQDDGSVPGLSRLPLIGWLFKSKAAANNRKELLIFITPRIVDRPAAIEAAR